MKRAFLCLHFMLAFGTSLAGQHIVIEDVNRNNKGYTAHLIDSETGAIVRSRTWMEKVPRDGQFMSLDNGRKVLFYMPSKKKKNPGVARVFDSIDLNETLRFEMHRPTAQLIASSGQQSAVLQSRDLQRLLVSAQHGRTQHLDVFDLSSGARLHSLPISRKDNRILISADEQRAVAHNHIGGPKRIQLLDLTLGKSLLTHTPTRDDVTVTLDRAHYFVRWEHKTNSMRRQTLQIRLLSNGDLVQTIESENDIAVAHSEASGESYLVWTEIDSLRRLHIARVDAQHQLHTLYTGELSIQRPSHAHFDDERQRLVVVSGQNNLILDVDGDRVVTGKSPFDADFGQSIDGGERVLIREQTGSEVALLDASDLSLIKRRGSGRGWIKMTHLLTSTIGVTTGLFHGYFFFVYAASNTGVVVDGHERHIYVINTKTHDVSVFNSEDLSDPQMHGLGRSYFLTVFQGHKDAPVVALSQNNALLFDPRSGEKLARIKLQKPLHVDAQGESLFDQYRREVLRVYSLRDGRLTAEFKDLDAYVILDVERTVDAIEF